MSGGLVQLTNTGDEDIHLTKNPEITFFKKVYKKHTNFSVDLKEIKTNSSINFGSKIVYNIPFQGDLLRNCFFEITIPKLSLTDSLISDSNYTTHKNSLLSAVQTKINSFTTLYTNFLNYSNIELIYYQKLKEIITSENITITVLKAKVTNLNVTYGTDRTTYKGLLATSVANLVDIAGYISALGGSESIADITTNIDSKYEIIYKYLNYYFSNKTYQTNKYNKIDAGKLGYGWSKYLGHYYLNNFEIKLGGKTFDKYNSDQLHIYQSHNINSSETENYNKMIGHDESLYKFSSETKNETKIYIPLIFWFNRDSHNSLPLVSCKKSNPILSVEINKLSNLICFNDWEQNFNDLLVVDVPWEEHNLNSNGSAILFSDLSYTDVEIVYPEYIYRYTCSYISQKLLDLQFSGISSSSVLTNYGSVQSDGNVGLNLNNWINLMNSLKTDTSLSTATKTLLGDYHYFVNYENLVSQVTSPSIKLVGEYVYLDEIERNNMIKNKLVYLIDTFNREKKEVTNIEKFNFNLDKDQICKKIFWYILPKLFEEGVSSYGRKLNGIFNKYNYYKNNIVNDVKILINGFNILNIGGNSDFYSKVIPYFYLNNKLPEGVFNTNFSLYPENSQPSGECNFGKLSNLIINVDINDLFRKEYYDSSSLTINPNAYDLEFNILFNNYNMLLINNGYSRLAFNDK